MSTLKPILLLLVLMLPIWASGGVQQAYGRWKVTTLEHTETIVAISEKAARRFVGTTLIVRPKRMRIGTEWCNGGELEEESENWEELLLGKVYAKGLRLPNPTTSVYGGCVVLFFRTADEVVFN